jgi:hypothetical protein
LFENRESAAFSKGDLQFLHATCKNSTLSTEEKDLWTQLHGAVGATVMASRGKTKNGKTTVIAA